MDEVRKLVEEFKKNVAAYKQLGIWNPEYHAREPKIQAYKLLIDLGFTPKQVVKKFQEILETIP